MKFEVKACDLGLSRERFGTCSLDTERHPSRGEPLRGRQRVARGVAGIGFIAAAVLPARVKPMRPVTVLAAWFGASHLVAATTGFRGCPELGAIPSVLLDREIVTECGPWEWLDARLERPAMRRIAGSGA